MSLRSDTFAAALPPILRRGQTLLGEQGEGPARALAPRAARPGDRVMRRMSQEETRVSAPGSCVPGFWDGVEREIETLDVFDLIEFL